MGTQNGLVAKFQEFATYVVNHGLVTSPECNIIRISYSEWYQSYEDDGTKVPKEGMSKYAAGILIYQQIDEQLKSWEGTTMEEKDSTIEESTTESNEAKIPLSAKIIIGSTIAGHATGKALNTIGTKVIAPAAKATGHWMATDGKAGAQTLGKATKAGWKAFIAGIKNK